MAFFRLEAKVISREKRGRSVVAAAAYRAGTKLRDERSDRLYDYARRRKGVVDSRILVPDGAPEWACDPGQLWNRVEAGEKRKDAQLAREYILAVPPELDTRAQFDTAVAWAQKQLVQAGMIAEVSLHHCKTGRNPHVHVLCTMRRLDGDKFSAKKAVEWNDVGLLVKQRESWAEVVNAALADAGRAERVDHRSLKDRGIDREPEPKIGVAATAMQRRGAEADPERCQLARRVKLLNELRPMIKALRRNGEIRQHGIGGNWWERSIGFMERAKAKAKKMVRSTWQRLTGARPAKEDRGEQEHSR